jgi:NAD(P)-dependent dehydrogenase (short-subunit alcohol dehydrogenase family)
MEKQLQDQVIIITGASTGIGRATARACAKEGAALVLADINDDDGNKLARELEVSGTRAMYQRCNVSQEDDVANLVYEAVSTFGQIHAAFNNAGIEGLRANTASCTTHNWDAIMDTNLKGVWLCMKYQIPEMLKYGSGAIVNCASVAGHIGIPEMPAYVASKHGLIGLTKTTALEYAALNIRINAVSPGVIQTPMIDRISTGHPELPKQFISAEPMQRIGQPEEIADAVVWLCSKRSSFVTGHALLVDGGWVAQ